jgi:hypothetical protein
MKLRIICCESDSGDAAHVGGPVHITHKTFDVPCPTELETWIVERDSRGAYHHLDILGIEVLRQ